MNKRASWKKKNRKYVPKKGTARTKAHHVWESPVNEMDLDGSGCSAVGKEVSERSRRQSAKSFIC